MKRRLKLTLVLLTALVAAPSAQQVVSVGDNANILPIHKSTPPGEPPALEDYLKGNLLGQRCNEPSIGISPINRNTMMVFCNDYRATFNFDDAMVPSGKTSFAAAVWNEIKTFFARVAGKPNPERAERKIEASSEAGIGGGITYDGVNYVGFMVPGGPNDSTPASVAHPGKGLMTGYSDAFAKGFTGKNGEAFIGVAYIGFNREPSSGNPSGIFFTLYQDLNNSDTVHNIVHVRDRMVTLSQNLSQGQFKDKVWFEFAKDGCLYISHTRFTGSAGSTNIYLSKSCDDGATWTSSAIDQNSRYGQGSAVFANPTDATKVGVLWRTFGTSSLVFKSTAKGAKNVDLFVNDPQGPYRAFDQYSQPIVVPGTNPPVDDKNRVAFRSLAFPWGAYTPDGKVLIVVFTEWINLQTGVPSTTGTLMPLIVMKYSTTNGATWSPRYVLNWQNGERGTVPAAPERLGFFSPARAVGAQFQPAIACAPGNVCAVVWKQAYEAQLNPGGPENPGSFVMAGFERRFDVRGVTLKFVSSALSGVTPSFQVSRYGYRPFAPTDKPSDVSDTNQWVDKMTLPNGTTYPIWNFDNTDHTGGGLQAFTGDYFDIENNTTPGEAPSFVVAFSDTRYNIRAWQTPTGGLVPQGQEPSYYRFFQAPAAQQPLSCLNYGSRVQSVMTARVNAGGLLISGQTNQKPFQNDQSPPRCGNGTQKCIEFPVTIWNTTGQHLKGETAVSLALTGSGSPFASFAKRPYDPALDGTDPYTYPLVQGSVEIYPYGSYSTVVYAFSGAPVTVTATIPGTSPAKITLNDPTVVNASAAASFEYEPSKVNIESGGLRTGGLRTGGLRTGGLRTGTPVSYPVPEDPVPGKTVYDVIDQTYVVTPSSSDDAGTYLSLFNIDPAYEGNYVFQVFVTKPLTSFMIDQDGQCSAFNFTEGALVGHISDPTNPLVNGGLRTGGLRTGGLRTGGLRTAIPSDGDPLVQNTSFTLGSSTELQSSGVSGLSAQATSAAASTGCRIDECTLAAPRLPNEVTILVRAYQITEIVPDERRYDPDGSRTGTATPPGVAVSEYSCDDPSCTAALGPDLAVQTSPTPTPVSPRRVNAGGQVTFPTLSIKNIGVDGQCGTETSPKPCGEARAHQWAVYASTEPDFEKVPRNNNVPGISGTVKVNTNPSQGPITVLLNTGELDKLACVPTAPDNPTCNGATELAAVGNVTIPASIPRTNADGTGTYFLHFYVDSGRVVNELDEFNNDWSDGPITVDAPGYGFLGLQTPCTGMTCNKTGTVPLAWQFTIGSVPVDSMSTLPRVRFYDSCPAPVGANGYPVGPVRATSEPNAADLTSGASGWQYFPNTGMTRPRFTWQLNFDSTGLPRGVCYSMYIEVPATGQVIGSTVPELRPFGPFFITAR
jgi:hypothetical protein